MTLRLIRNFIWEGNESGGGRDWFFSYYMEEVQGLEKNARAFLMKVAIGGRSFDRILLEFSKGGISRNENSSHLHDIFYPLILESLIFNR